MYANGAAVHLFALGVGRGVEGTGETPSCGTSLTPLHPPASSPFPCYYVRVSCLWALFCFTSLLGLPPTPPTSSPLQPCPRRSLRR